jgi:hypothetical protein
MHLDDGFGHWLAGFVDGEGCFRVKPNNVNAFACVFDLHIRADDSEALYEIQRRLGVGRISYEDRKDSSPMCCLTVTKKADCRVLVDVLTRYPLRAKKRRDFAIWREAVEEWATLGHCGKAVQDWSRMAEFKRALEAVKKFRAEAPVVPARIEQQMALAP